MDTNAHYTLTLGAFLNAIAALTLHAPDSGSLAKERQKWAENLPLPAELEGIRDTLKALSHGTPLPEQELLQRAAKYAALPSPDGKASSHYLSCVFQHISLSGSTAKHGKQQIYAPSTLDKAVFPVESLQKGAFPDHAKAFCEKLRELPTDIGAPLFLKAFLSLCENFLWCVPFPGTTTATGYEISAYDAARIQSAIAQALLVAEDSDTPFLLCGGDISGIQSYIFNASSEHSKGLAKFYRARSFYLQALTKSVVLAILDATGLGPCAQIMDAGGRFVLLLPATDKIKAQLATLEQKLQHWLFDHFHGELGVSLSYDTCLGTDELSGPAFRAAFDRFNDALDSAKLHKFSRLMQSRTSPVSDLDYTKGICELCRLNPQSDTLKHKDVRVCEQCRAQIDTIGFRLPKTQYTYLIYEKKTAEKLSRDEVPLFNDISLRFAEEIDAKETAQVLEISNIRNREDHAFHPLAAHLPVFTEEDIARWEKDGLGEKDEEQLIHQGLPVKKDEPKNLSMLAEESRHMECDPETQENALVGVALLGTLKADVDNLGLIFSAGLGKAISIANSAALSRMMNHFFAYQLVQRIKNEFPNIYVVFAGGDDLFLLGPWDNIVEFAKILAEDFKRYVGGNPCITLSAGIAISKPHVPMRTLGEQAEELLERSKEWRGDSSGVIQKNAVTLFDITQSWKDFPERLEEAKLFESMLRTGKLSMGSIFRLLHYSQEARRVYCEGKLEHIIYRSRMHYNFARHIEPHIQQGESESGEQDIEYLTAKEEKLLSALMTDHKKLITARLPLSCALYRLRKE
ncbi:type III-A CRISPR-associated protein Cas10/Csm1 [Desulfobaculum bizertense]|uniref:CRISPR system single-strand-specific deoxyribonuclease Cas10/Csm1 (subtype III-A) n=1 Tax=Desulfobaculum bizertense DSM 18034 TaxID=1121442 RepID=A0A1T4VTU0_9BACT|nr:type III-A CRISPR-associated protein Cas10/Csm1 [Desulfobaculum bizertense]SKA67921.1 CRISPR-associated protein Cas10/Csm1, subtype III-A/MTUBE [Desulfobaculum bizertense DSM 18034]